MCKLLIRVPISIMGIYIDMISYICYIYMYTFIPLDVYYMYTSIPLCLHVCIKRTHVLYNISTTTHVEYAELGLRAEQAGGLSDRVEKEQAWSDAFLAQLGEEEGKEVRGCAVCGVPETRKVGGREMFGHH